MAIHQERPQAPQRRRRRIAAVMGLEAASLLVASLLHLSGFAHGHARPFTATGAGIAEAVIGIVVACGAIALMRPGARGRGTALAVTAFAIIGVIYGLNITAQGGDLPDIVYHATLLPLLIATFALLLRTSRRSGGNRDAVETSSRAVRPGSVPPAR
jgi:peptidoglycan/LPS O-acetylase OafA/YrhL